MAESKERLYHCCFSSLLWNTPLGWVQENQEGPKLSGAYQILTYAEGLIVVRENTSKEVGLEVNLEKNDYFFNVTQS
jgi:hypothetical protein